MRPSLLSVLIPVSGNAAKNTIAILHKRRHGIVRAVAGLQPLSTEDFINYIAIMTNPCDNLKDGIAPPKHNEFRGVRMVSTSTSALALRNAAPRQTDDDKDNYLRERDGPLPRQSRGK